MRKNVPLGCFQTSSYTRVRECRLRDLLTQMKSQMSNSYFIIQVLLMRIKFQCGCGFRTSSGGKLLCRVDGRGG